MQSGFASRFAAWRAARGLTLQEVASVIGVSRQAISYVEAGTNDLSVGKLDTICRDAFGIDLPTFFGPLPDEGAKVKARKC